MLKKKKKMFRRENKKANKLHRVHLIELQIKNLKPRAAFPETPQL